MDSRLGTCSICGRLGEYHPDHPDHTRPLEAVYLCHEHHLGLHDFTDRILPTAMAKLVADIEAVVLKETGGMN